MAHHFTSTSKRAMMEWRHAGSPTRKKFKVTPSAGNRFLGYDWCYPKRVFGAWPYHKCQSLLYHLTSFGSKWLFHFSSIEAKLIRNTVYFRRCSENSCWEIAQWAGPWLLLRWDKQVGRTFWQMPKQVWRLCGKVKARCVFWFPFVSCFYC